MIGIILAGGRGKRMKSPIPKVLSEVNGVPILERIVIQMKKTVEKIVVVVNPDNHEMISARLGEDVAYVVQDKPLGTGHAVMVAMESIGEVGGEILVCCGDMPLLRSSVFEEMVTYGRFVVCAFEVDDPYGYGRVIEDGAMVRIVEEKDCSDEQKEIRLVNSGIYIFPSEGLRKVLPLLSNENRQNEFYITDAVGLLQQTGCRIMKLPMYRNFLLRGINTPEELAQVNSIFQPEFILLQDHVGEDYQKMSGCFEDFSRLLGHLTECPYQFETFFVRLQSIKRLFPFIQIYVAYHKYIGIYACGTLLIEPKFIHGCSSVGHIEDVVVIPELHHEQIGSRLIAFLVDKALKGHECYKVSLDSKPENAGFYRKMGFDSKEQHFAIKPL